MTAQGPARLAGSCPLPCPLCQLTLCPRTCRTALVCRGTMMGHLAMVDGRAFDKWSFLDAFTWCARCG